LEFPVCTFDLRTGVLCSKCEEKLNKGEITGFELEVMRLLLEAERIIPQAASLTYLRSFRINEHIFIVFKARDLSSLPAPILSQLKEFLTKKLGPRLVILEDNPDLNSLVQTLVAPARLLTINKVWLPDQSVEMKAVVEDDKKLKIPPNVLSEFVRKFKNIVMNFEFQRSGRVFERRRGGFS